jgi:hypothetical protein
MRKNIFIILFWFASAQLFAQDVEFIVGIDSNEVLIGDYIHLKVSLRYPTEKYSLIFPNVNETFTAPFKIIEQSKIDTTESSRYTTLQQTTTIASYDSGLYKLEKLHVNGFKTDADSAVDIASDSLLIRVSEVMINTNGDIKDIINAEKKSILLRNVMISIGIILIVGLLFYLIYKYKQRKKIPIPIKPIDAYEYANTQLIKIKNVTPINIIESKKYYSTITDAVKYYLQHRYELAVTDKTSDETIDVLRQENKTKQIVLPVQQILQIADMVKFAKLDVSELQNKNTWQQAYDLIQSLEQNYQVAQQQIVETQKKNG